MFLNAAVLDFDDEDYCGQGELSDWDEELEALEELRTEE